MISLQSHEMRKCAKEKSIDDQFAMVEPVQAKSDLTIPVHESAFINLSNGCKQCTTARLPSPKSLDQN